MKLYYPSYASLIRNNNKATALCESCLLAISFLLLFRISVQNAKQPIIAYFGLQTVGDTASIGSNINLTCIMENAELGTFLKSGRPVTEGERITYLFQGSARGLNSSLEIVDVQRNDSGVYSCIAYNAGIIATREFVLKTGLPPFFVFNFSEFIFVK